MLDFYIIKDDQAKPNYPKKLELEFVGGLDEKTLIICRTKELLTGDLTITQTSD